MQVNNNLIHSSSVEQFHKTVLSPCTVTDSEPKLVALVTKDEGGEGVTITSHVYNPLSNC